MGKFKDFAERRQTGCYVSCDYDAATGSALESWAAHNLIPQPLASSKYHSTILYSRKDVPTAEEIIQKFKVDRGIIRAIGFRLFESKEDPDCRALVIELKATQLVGLYQDLIAAGGTHDYPDFVPHVTVSYYAPRDMKTDHLELPKFAFRMKDLKVEPLDINWKDK